MIKLIAIIIAVFSFYTALSFFLSRRNEDNVVDMKDYQNPSKSFKQMLSFIIVGIALTVLALFFLPKLGMNVGDFFRDYLHSFH